MASDLLASVRDAQGLMEAFKARRHELGYSQAECDAACGLQGGYTGKLECGTKGLGPLSISMLATGLGLRIDLVRASSTHRENGVTTKAYAQANKKFLKQRAAAGGSKRARNMTDDQRRKSASHAAKSRWRDWRRMKAERELSEKKKAASITANLLKQCSHEPINIPGMETKND